MEVDKWTKETISTDRVEAAQRYYSKALERIRAALPEEAAGVVAVEYLMSAYAYKLEHEAILSCIAIICEDCRTHKHGGESCIKAADLWKFLMSLEPNL